ncbi:MAG: serine/threonine-protein kinase [Myxococcales bacterium]|nr:protein kinase [Polyangiaceae bacterium]MDW8249065.1 serine/threonine-protein kinase [Myxococcales bacterium]
MTIETDALVGAVLAGRWRLKRKLGEGGMGAVYAAEGVNGEGEVAVKILHKEFVKEDQVVSRFYAEAEASKRLNHPNIARVFESGTAESGEPFLVMELLRGQPLADACPEGSRLPVADAARIMKEVLIALAEAHRQDIVHRDLKPDNIFLCDVPGGGRVAKLLDFGIARVIDAASGGAMRKTKTGMLLGTPGYMSPEQLRNSKTVDPRGDLWSLSTVFYEILSGRDPYGATNDFARLTAVFTQDSIPIDRDAPELAPWREFFQRAFQRDINLRFQSAQEMSAAIDAVLEGRPLPAPVQPSPPAAPQQPITSTSPTYTKPSPQDQLALASTQPSGFVVPEAALAASRQSTASSLVVLSPPLPARPPASLAIQPSIGSNKLVWALIVGVLILGAVLVGLAVWVLRSNPSSQESPPTSTTATPSSATGKPAGTVSSPPKTPPGKR